MKLPNDVTLVDSGIPGPVVAIFAGVHGNEKAGVYALNKLLPELSITRGRLYIVFANPPAIEQDVRMVNKNLNRCFFKGNDGTAPEDVRARQLMGVLDMCDAMLDLHMFYDNNGLPFVICEDNALDLAKIFDVEVISTNWSETEPGGTDGYMYEAGKIGICIECGPISKSVEYTDFAQTAVLQFLSYFDMSSRVVAYSDSQKRIIRAEKAVFKDSMNFDLKPGFSNFQRLKTGEVLAKNGDTLLRAGDGECIIFPHYKARVGEEAYILGRELPDHEI